ncbi:MAG: exodeoxyribonuclease V subunit beta [Betaproteobacteria bacterium]|nr:exodeoxyribonuclease V subunit beta [Betaproteobacteria bacterium]
MSVPEEFKVFDCDLDGINLIEASAGTGKTWTICGLYLRLLLERRLEVQQILVVTFTNAATAELRERIRSRIAETLAYLRDGAATGEAASTGEARSTRDPFVPELVSAVERNTGLERRALEAALDRALQFFDEAAIFTIHGYCQRALADASFSAGLPFSLELVTDDREMAVEAVQDFWRRRVADAGCPPELAAWLIQKKDSPDKYAKLLLRSVAKPMARALWPTALDAAPTPIDATAPTAAWDTARGLWVAQRDAIIASVTGALSALNANTYRPDSIGRAVGEWDAWFREGLPFTQVPENDKLDLLSRRTLTARTKKNQVTPTHPFFDAADALLAERQAITQALDLARLRLIRDLIDTVVPDLRRRKRERRVISFDDMLCNLHDALEDGDHPELAASLRQKFPVALIDEFQDTDPLQFAIFERIYGNGHLPAFLVGDPKQAIYSFRHADLHTYLRARQSASTVRTLAANQRSTQGLIEALNGLFSTKPDAFMLPGLDYHRVTMGDRRRLPFTDTSAHTTTDASAHPAPDRAARRADLQVWTLPQAHDGEPMPKAEARTRAARATAAEIARLVTEGAQGRIRIGERPLRPVDIAVLVRTHAQGSELKRELAALCIGSVELSQASVFQTPDAEEVERVLIAINQPSRDTLLRGALATEMLGCDAAEIEAISRSEDEITKRLARFADYRDLWLRRGVGVMYRRLLSAEGVSARMLRRDDGERRLTNLLHLGEQIHQAAVTHESPDALLRWLAAQRRDGAADEVAQLRLESDRNLVQIVTIYKAKGLEFPIVFCPFLWDGSTRFGGPKPEGREYHADDGTALIDFRSDDELGPQKALIGDRIKLEASAESLRLIYVALTRAVYRCYLIAGTYGTNRSGKVSTSQSTRSLLNWLVAGGNESPKAWLDGKRPPADIAAAWEALAGRLAPHLALAPLPGEIGTPVALPGPAPESLTVLPPPKAIATAWRLGSFSGLASDAKSEGAANDHDARIADGAKRIGLPPPSLAPDDILRFPRGTGAGDCLHAIFERIDFTAPADWDGAITDALSAHPQFGSGVGVGMAGQSAGFASMAKRMLSDVMRTTLPDGIVLGSIPATRRLTELEFSLPSQSLSANALNAALKSLGYEVPRLAFRDLEGYLRGFIDLVFEHGGRYYVLDWKSNHLGYAPADYGPAALLATMSEHGYHLQYLLYSLAVGRYLAHRVPGYRHDTHFGGVLYLFVRGVRPGWVNADGSPAGVFSQRPTAAALARLDALFATASTKVSR